MHIASTFRGIGSAVSVIALAMAFSACRPKSPETPPAPTPPEPEVSARAEPAPSPAAPTIDTMKPAAMPQPTAPVLAQRPRVPDISSMKLAQPSSSKLGVPVDLHYQLEGDAQAGRPATLHLAAVPRVAGGNLNVSIKESAGIQATAPALAIQKASAGTAYRQQLSVTRAADGPSELRVLVTMELPEGSAFSWFGVPLAR
jgi:hypothetical protein